MFQRYNQYIQRYEDNYRDRDAFTLILFADLSRKLQELDDIKDLISNAEYEALLSCLMPPPVTLQTEKNDYSEQYKCQCGNAYLDNKRLCYLFLLIIRVIGHHFQCFF